jgi:hypothetical protein
MSAIQEASKAPSWAALDQDRRLYPRKFLSGTGFLVVPGRPTFEIHTLDISMGGMGVVSPWNLPYDLLCEIHFTLAREPAGVDILAAPARVAHSILSGRENGFLVGLQFVNLSPNTAATISRFMAVQSPIIGG